MIIGVRCFEMEEFMMRGSSGFLNVYGSVIVKDSNLEGLLSLFFDLDDAIKLVDPYNGSSKIVFGYSITWNELHTISGMCDVVDLYVTDCLGYRYRYDGNTFTKMLTIDPKKLKSVVTKEQYDNIIEADLSGGYLECDRRPYSNIHYQRHGK